MAAKRPRATPDLVLDAALRVARERGWPAVTIRAVADALGYASPLLYEHFAGKEAMLVAAARRGFGALAEDLADVSGEPGSDARIVALGVAYVAYARREPELYRVMHGLDGVVAQPGAIAAEASGVVEIAAGELSRWAGANGVAMPDPFAATEALWCLVHGIASLALADRLTTDPTTLTESMVEALVAGWRARGNVWP